MVEAVAGRAEILMDGGIRRGSDIVKALCLGARGRIDRAAVYAYGLAAAGSAGVACAISILKTDVERTLRLLQELDPTYLTHCAQPARRAREVFDYCR